MSDINSPMNACMYKDNCLETIRTHQAEIDRLKGQRDRLVQALDDASQAVWGYSDYRHDMGHIDIADKFNLMYGEHRALIAEIEAEND